MVKKYAVLSRKCSQNNIAAASYITIVLKLFIDLPMWGSSISSVRELHACRKMSSVEQIPKAGGITTPKSESNEPGMKVKKRQDNEETPSKLDVVDDDSLINMCQKLGLTTPESERKEPLVQTKPRKKRKSEDNEGETPEIKEAKEKEEEDLIFLPVAVDLDKLRDWALPGSEGEKGALVEVNNQQVLSILMKLNL